jgi:hypothetical protein
MISRTISLAVSKPIRIDLAFGLIVFLNIAFQKLALPNGEMIGVPMFVVWGVLAYLMFRGVAVVDPLRASLFGLMFGAIIMSIIIERRLDKGFNPLILFLICYIPMMIRIDVDRETLLRCLNKYQLAISIVACIVIGQQLMQFSVGSTYWPNYEKMVPKSLLIPGYMYIRPYDWDSAFLTPNGFFFLEPSGVSEYLALGVACEIIWFKRPWRLALLAFATIAAMAGTGIVILTLMSPFLWRHLDHKLRKMIVCVGLPVLLLGVAAGAFSHLTERSGEMSESNSSGHGRLVAPFEDTVKLATDPSYLIVGNGPGSSAKIGDLGLSDEAEVQWPSDKMIFEYGLLSAILYYAFMLVMAYRFSPHPVLASVMFIPHMCFGGGFVTTTGVVALVLFCSLLRLKEHAPSHAQLRKPRLRSVFVGARAVAQ